jgi:hypothetical protein
MTKQQENGMAIITAAVIIALLFLSSCATKKTVTEYITIHDTLTTYRTDTIRDVKYLHHTDTVTNREVHTYTINDVGDTVKEIHHYHDTEKVIIVDSTDRYRAVVDSLQRIVDAKAEKTTVKVRQTVPWWEKGTFLAIVFFVCIAILKSRTK